MPELRSRRMVTPLKVGFGMRRRLEDAGERGVFRRVPSPGNGGRRVSRVVRRVRDLEEDKENIPPRGYNTRDRARKSQLPEWYPRTPLRDITAIINAIERKNRRLREMAQQAQSSSEDVKRPPVNLVQPEPKAAKNAVVVSVDCKPPPCVVSSVEPICDMSVLLSPGSSSKTPLANSEEKLTRTIDTIEKIMKEKLKNAPRDPVKTAKRRTLMSLR